jgi:folate-binding protein YgfZ
MVAKIARLESRAVIRIEGPEWRPFLHNLLTHDIEGLEPGGLRFAALLTPQGKFLHEVFVFAGEDEALLDVQAAHRDDLLRRLTLYKLRAKVTLASVEIPVFARFDPAALSSSAHPRESGDPGVFRPDPRLAALGSRALGAPIDPDASEDAYDAHRLTLGVPDPARDLVPDKTFPIEANLDLLNGIDFKKGCFIGQETTSRMKRRGIIKTRMLPITFDGAPPPFGAEVLAGELRAGEVLSGREGRAMALLRLDRIEGAELTAHGRPVAAEHPDWMGRFNSQTDKA